MSPRKALSLIHSLLGNRGNISTKYCEVTNGHLWLWGVLIFWKVIIEHNSFELKALLRGRLSELMSCEPSNETCGRPKIAYSYYVLVIFKIIIFTFYFFRVKIQDCCRCMVWPGKSFAIGALDQWKQIKWIRQYQPWRRKKLPKNHLNHCCHFWAAARFLFGLHSIQLWPKLTS